MATDAKIAKLKTKRDVCASQLGRIKEFVDTIDNKIPPVSLATIEVRLEALQKSFESFLVLQNAIEELDEIELEENDRALFEESYFTLKPVLLTLKNKIKFDNNSNLNKSDDSQTSIKLPKISLPKFSGSYTEWVPFSATFNSLVDNNKQLDELSKFHYLRTSLSGPALNRIQSIEITPENYKVALKLLKDRYDNSKLIAQEHFKGLFNFPSLEKGQVTATRLRELIDKTNNHLEALASLGRATAQWDDMVVYLILSKLDTTNRSKWEYECHTDRLSTLHELFVFLDRWCQVLDATSQVNKTTSIDSTVPNSNKFKSHSTKPQFKSSSLIAIPESKCHFCSQSKHTIYRCRKFIALPPTERLLAVKRLNLCVNCLRNTHSIDNCPQSTCRECGCKHNTLLHQFSTIESAHSIASTSNSEKVNTKSIEPKLNHVNQSHQSSCNVSNYHISSSESYVLLATVVIHILDHTGAPVSCRAILDSGSQSHFISQALISKLGLSTSPINHRVNGIANSSILSNKAVTINIQSRLNSFNAQLSAMILPEITNCQPSKFINIKNWPLPPNIELADPNFNCPQQIDLLIGAEFHLNLLINQSIDLGVNLPFLQDTVFGWIISGKCNNISYNHSTSNFLSLDQVVQQFWEIENHVHVSNPITIEQANCEENFVNTVKRNSSGRFIVDVLR